VREAQTARKKSGRLVRPRLLAAVVLAATIIPVIDGVIILRHQRR
jgi:hypothetical protein